MDLFPDERSEFGQRVRRRLREEHVGWLTTVGGDGTPQPNPVWFWWDEARSLLIYNRADAQRLPHIAVRPRVSLHLNSNTQGDDIVVLVGAAERRADTQPPHEHGGYRAKYESGMVRVSGSAAAFGTAYPVPIAVQIERVRGF